MTLLTDEQYLEFLSEGYLVISPCAMTSHDHAGLYQSAAQLYQRADTLKSRNAHLEILGDNVRTLIPDVDLMLNDPAVVAAVTSILGERYALHPHNFVHRSSSADQVFHQDGNLPWNERGHYRSHRPDWLILFYYPQAVDLTNGPTEVVPGSQYWTKDFETDEGWHPGDAMDRAFTPDVMNNEDLSYRDKRLQQGLNSIGVPDLKRRFIEVPAGSVVLANYDLIHRGSRKLPDTPDRFMYKFYFARTAEPRSAAWDHKGNPTISRESGVRSELQPIIRHIWQWSCAEQNSATEPTDVSALSEQLLTGIEHEQVEAAYVLGSTATLEAEDALLLALQCERESARRAAAYGLRCQGARVSTKVITALQSDNPRVRRVAAYALGTADAATNEVTDALLHCINTDQDDLARSNAAYSVGQIVRADHCDHQKIAAALIARLAPGIEPDNTAVAGLSRSTVRQSLGYALMQLVENHRLSDELIKVVAGIATTDSDRYIKGMLLEALIQFAGPDSVIGQLAGGLSSQRWNVSPQAEVD